MPAVSPYTAVPYTSRDKPADPTARPVYQGANPYSDLSTLEAIRLIGANLVEAVKQPGATEFREKLMFAGMLAGIGFGNSGVHIPHAMAYAVAGLVRDYYPQGWKSNHPMVPHGTSVIVNAPAAFGLQALLAQSGTSRRPKPWARIRPVPTSPMAATFLPTVSST